MPREARLYSTGKPCRNGHTCGRYVSNGRCVECQRATNHQPHIRGIQKAYRARPEIKEADKQYYTQKRMSVIASLPSPIKAGHCDLCCKPTDPLCWDHDHTLEALGFSPVETHRGWLCVPCNTALGKLGDDVTGLQRALDYVKGTRK